MVVVLMIPEPATCRSVSTTLVGACWLTHLKDKTIDSGWFPAALFSSTGSFTAVQATDMNVEFGRRYG